MSKSNRLRYKWFTVRWMLLRSDTSKERILAATRRALAENTAVLFYTGPWMNTHHNTLSKDGETARLMEIADWIRGAQRNGYTVTIYPNGEIRTSPEIPTPTDKDTQG
jgi:hypothetical protein